MLDEAATNSLYQNNFSYREILPDTCSFHMILILLRSIPLSQHHLQTFLTNIYSSQLIVFPGPLKSLSLLDIVSLSKDFFRQSSRMCFDFDLKESDNFTRLKKIRRRFTMIEQRRSLIGVLHRKSSKNTWNQKKVRGIHPDANINLK